MLNLALKALVFTLRLTGLSIAAVILYMLVVFLSVWFS